MSDKTIGSHIDLLADDQSVPQSLSQESGIYTKDGTKKKNNRARANRIRKTKRMRSPFLTKKYDRDMESYVADEIRNEERGDEVIEPQERTPSDDEIKRQVAELSQDIARAITAETGRTEENDTTRHEYSIGEFTFHTYYEFRNAEEDVKRIDIINKELDLKDPEVAIRLYNDIRMGKIMFKSPIGEKFFDHVADIVADRSVGLLEDKQVVDEAESQAKKQKWLALLIIILAAAAFSYFAYSEISDVISTRKLEKQIEEKNKLNPGTGKAKDDSATTADGNQTDKNQTITGSTFVDPSTLTILPEYEGLVAQNKEMVGWIEIPDTEVNYPVVQKADDNSYYLTHAFDQSEDKNGSIFMDYRSSVVNTTTNTILYGHNMASGKMFAALKNYENASYLEAHKTVTFNTIYEQRTYEIVAVCLGQVENQDSSGYRYYNFISAQKAQDMQDFVDYVSSRNIYGKQVEISTTDQLLTLSTCNHYIEDGRLFLVAKRVR
jgi:sortase B